MTIDDALNWFADALCEGYAYHNLYDDAYHFKGVVAIVTNDGDEKPSFKMMTAEDFISRCELAATLFLENGALPEDSDQYDEFLDNRYLCFIHAEVHRGEDIEEEIDE